MHACAILAFGLRAVFPAAAAEEGAESLREFLKLNEVLPTAVCDEAFVSKAPTLISGRGAVPGTGPAAERSGLYGHASTMGESELISFLMEDAATLAATRPIMSLWESERGAPSAPDAAAKLSEFRRRISLELCTALVTPGAIEAILDRRPGYFIDLEPVEGASHSLGALGAKAAGGGVRFLLRDGSRRFGVLRGRWRAAGWLEPHEVEEARSGRRLYRRLANPITRSVHLVEVGTVGGVPLGYLYPVVGPGRGELGAAPEAADKRSEIYRLRIQGAAYEALELRPEAAGRIRDLQEFYLSLLKAYAIYPEDARFAGYGDARASEALEREARAAIDAGFRKALSRALMNGARIEFAEVRPDARLQGILGEYQGRLAQVLRPSLK